MDQPFAPTRVPRRTRAVVAAIAVALVAALVPAFASPAGADHVEPTFVAANRSCGQLGYEHEFKINGVPANTVYPITVEDVDGTITITNGTNVSFDFTSTIPVEAVFVKAGSGGYLYAYEPPVLADTGLISPDNDGGNQATISHVSFCFGDFVRPAAELTIEKTAVPTYARDFDWTIDKSVTPALITTAEDTATFHYTVAVTKGAAVDSGHAVSGVITIFNPNGAGTPAATITSITDAIEGDPAAASCVLDYNGVTAGLGTAPTSIASGGTVLVDYTCTFASAAAALLTDSNTATVNWVDPNTQAGLDASAVQGYAWPAPATVTDHEVVVQDVFNGLPPEVLGTISASTTFNYDRTVNVPASGCVTYANTATVIETGDDSFDSASVQACRKTNDGFTRGFWTNKNGAKWIDANEAAVQTMLNTYSDVLAGVLATSSSIASHIAGSNSSGDGFPQFRAQFLATALSVLKSPGGSLGGQFVTGPGDECKSITEWLVYGNANLDTLLLDKAALLELKDLYDAVNNNVAPSCIP
jgi:hypothetical protein